MVKILKELAANQLVWLNIFTVLLSEFYQDFRKPFRKTFSFDGSSRIFEIYRCELSIF